MKNCLTVLLFWAKYYTRTILKNILREFIVLLFSWKIESSVMIVSIYWFVHQHFLHHIVEITSTFYKWHSNGLSLIVLFMGFLIAFKQLSDNHVIWLWKYCLFYCLKTATWLYISFKIICCSIHFTQIVKCKNLTNLWHTLNLFIYFCFISCSCTWVHHWYPRSWLTCLLWL